MKATFRLPWKEGIIKLRKQAEWLRPLHPDAAASLEEGLGELFTINRLELSFCIATLPGDDEHHRQFPLRCSYPHTSGRSMAEW